MQVLFKEFPQPPLSELPCDFHPWRGEEQPGLGLRILQREDQTEQGQVDQNQQAHEEYPPDQLQQLPQQPDSAAGGEGGGEELQGDDGEHGGQIINVFE